VPEIVKMTEFSSFEPRQQGLLAIFDALKIPHETWLHPPIFTVEEGIRLNLPARIPGRHGKSLFLTCPKTGFWLVVAAEDTRIDLKKLAGTVGAKRFSFGKPEKMVELLGVTPGSATPFALMNDAGRQVSVVLDAQVGNAALCVFHPLKNNASTAISGENLLLFIKHFGYNPQVLELNENGLN
jgi:Ala-tRNA(Pro) deacylase